MAYLGFRRCVQQGCLRLIYVMVDRKPESKICKELTVVMNQGLLNMQVPLC